MILHQIFLQVSDKTIEDYPCYIDGMNKWKLFCKEHGWEYMLHTEIDTSIMTADEIDICKQGTKRYPFYPVDYYRYIFLDHYGGLYVDLDVSPTDKFKDIMDREIILPMGRILNGTGNDFIKLSPDMATTLRHYATNQTKEKLNIKVYETWIKRFLLQSVGPSMMSRFIKLNNLTKYKIMVSDYCIDHATYSWENC